MRFIEYIAAPTARVQAFVASTGRRELARRSTSGCSTCSSHHPQPSRTSGAAHNSPRVGALDQPHWPRW